MFKVNNKDIRTMPGVVLVSLLLTLNLFHILLTLMLTLNMQLPAGKPLELVHDQPNLLN